MKHTPLIHHGGLGIFDKDGNLYASVSRYHEANRDEIIRACNSHDALVAACRAVVAAFTTSIGVPVRKRHINTPMGMGASYLSPAGMIVPSEVYEIARDALAASETKWCRAAGHIGPAAPVDGTIQEEEAP